MIGLIRTPWTLMRRSFSNTTTRSLIEVQDVDGLRKITLNDMKTRNALSLQMMEQLIAAIEKDKSDVKLRSIIIGACNGPVFSAGHNLKELTADKGIDAQRAIFAKCTQLMLSIRNAEVPVIAAVKGLAAAAGCQLVASCDFAIATDKAQFSTPGANFGVFCTTPGISVSRSVNRGIAAYMILTGLPLSAPEALQAGLIAKICTDDQFDDTLMELYSAIKSKSRPIIKLGKEFFYKQIETSYEDALRKGESIMVQNLQLSDSQEGLNSFKEKRQPTWTHKDEE